MSNDRSKTINAKQAVNDVRSGMADAELMGKYGLSAKGLQVLLKKLIDTGRLQQHEMEARASVMDEPARITWKCPACGDPQTRAYDECPNCGVIVAKLHARDEDSPDRRDDFAGAPAMPPAMSSGSVSTGGIYSERDPAGRCAATTAATARGGPLAVRDYDETGEASKDSDDWPLEPRKMDKPEWTMLLVGPGVALVCFLFFWFKWTLLTFKTLVHEMGHAIFGWAFGYPSLPAFDFLWGGGITLHFDRSTSMLILIYIGLAALIYLYRKNTATVIFLAVVVCLHALFSCTDINLVIILFMGHGTELIIGGLFIYRSLSGRAIIHPWERPLYAVAGFFIVFSDIAFGFSLLTSADFRQEYLEGKGGVLDNDFLRIARDHLHVKMNSVVLFFFFCSVITPILGFLAFRYEEYVHSVIAALWTREPERIPH